MPKPRPPKAAAQAAPGDPYWNADLAALDRLVPKPRKVTGPDNWINGLQLFVEYLATVPPRMQKITSPLRRYPKDFTRVDIQARDGVRLVGRLGLATNPNNGHERGGEARDGLLLIPGLYTTKDNARIRARSLRMLREWGFHVLALDARGVGESDRTFSTPGWKEAEDIIDTLAVFRRVANLRRVHLYAESLAASAAIIAAGMEAQAGRRLLNGRVIAVSPFASAEHIVELYGTPHPETTPLGPDFAVVQRFFNVLLRFQGYKGGRFDAYSHDGAKHYGIPYEEFLHRSSPQEYVADVNVPLLILHSTDDGLVPVAEAEELRRRAHANPNVNVRILPWGYHCLYEMAEPDWYWRMLERVYGHPAPKTKLASTAP